MSKLCVCNSSPPVMVLSCKLRQLKQSCLINNVKGWSTFSVKILPADKTSNELSNAQIRFFWELLDDSSWMNHQLLRIIPLINDVMNQYDSFKEFCLNCWYPVNYKTFQSITTFSPAIRKPSIMKIHFWQRHAEVELIHTSAGRRLRFIRPSSDLKLS